MGFLMEVAVIILTMVLTPEFLVITKLVLGPQREGRRSRRSCWPAAAVSVRRLWSPGGGERLAP